MHVARYHILSAVFLVVGTQVCICRPQLWGVEPLATTAVLLPEAAPTSEPASIAWLNEYNAARLQGIQQARPVLLFITTEHCSYCEKMQSQTFSDSRIIQDLHQSFVPARLKLDPRSELAQQLRITIYPTTLIIDPDGTILDYARGYLSTEDLRHRMSQATLSVNRLASTKAGQP